MLSQWGFRRAKRPSRLTTLRDVLVLIRSLEQKLAPRTSELESASTVTEATRGLRFSLCSERNGSLSSGTGELYAGGSELVSFSAETTTESPDYNVGGTVPYETPGSDVSVKQVNFITSYMHWLNGSVPSQPGCFNFRSGCNLCTELPQ